MSCAKTPGTYVKHLDIYDEFHSVKTDTLPLLHAFRNTCNDPCEVAREVHPDQTGTLFHSGGAHNRYIHPFQDEHVYDLVHTDSLAQ